MVLPFRTILRSGYVRPFIELFFARGGRNRVESKAVKYSMEKFHEKRHAFGTVAMIENTGKSSREIYVDYKTRGEVETMIDTLKNVVDADRTCMQNELALEGWMFVNMIALKWYYVIPIVR